MDRRKFEKGDDDTRGEKHSRSTLKEMKTRMKEFNRYLKEGEMMKKKKTKKGKRKHPHKPYHSISLEG